MPGAGSFVAAKYLYGVAPKDGTYFGIVSQTFALDAVMNEDEANFDASKLPVVGRLAESVDVGIGRPGASFKTMDDVRKREIVVASTGGSSPGFLMPAALSRFGAAKFKIISGYAGSTEAELALQRGEADLAASVALLTIQQKYPEWLKEQGGAPILYVSGLKRSPIIPWVPHLGELGTSEAGTKVLRAIGASAEIGKSILTTPGIPPDRLAILRTAFQDMLKDKAFIDVMAQRQIPISGASGEDMDKLVREVKETPREVISMLRDLVKS
jgi:tripartite-type tricarboxylate transporter receptor subunit TctC